MCQAWTRIFVARQFPAICTTPFYPNFFRMSCEIFMFLGTGRSSAGTNGGSSRLKIGRGTSSSSSLKTPEGAHREPLIASNVVSSSIAFTALDLITRPPPFCATMCASEWKRLPSHVPKCYVSVMTPPGTFPATLNITAVTSGKSAPRC